MCPTSFVHQPTNQQWLLVHNINQYQMGSECSIHGGNKKCILFFCFNTSEERYHIRVFGIHKNNIKMNLKDVGCEYGNWDCHYMLTERRKDGQRNFNRHSGESEVMGYCGNSSASLDLTP
jgi:hypothetical protein